MNRYCDAISLIDKQKLVDIDHSDPHSSPLPSLLAIHIDHQLFNNLSFFFGFFSFNVLSLMVDFFRFRATTFQQTPCHTLCGPKFKFLYPYYRFKHFCHVLSPCVLHALHFATQKRCIFSIPYPKTLVTLRTSAAGHLKYKSSTFQLQRNPHAVEE